MAAPFALRFRSKIKIIPSVLSSTSCLRPPSNYIFQKRWRKGQSRFIIYHPDDTHHVAGIPVHPDRKFPTVEDLTEETDIAEYPPVKPKFPPGSWGSMDREKAWMYHNLKENMLEIPSASERHQVFLNRKRTKMEKWIGEIKETPPHYCVVLDKMNDHPKTLPFRNYVTKTHVTDWKIKEEKTDLTEEDQSFINQKPIYLKVKQDISDFLVFDSENVVRQDMSSSLKNNMRSSLLFRCISDSIINHASEEFPHFRKCQYDEDVIVRALWHRFGIEKPEIKKDLSKSPLRTKEDPDYWNYNLTKWEKEGLSENFLRKPQLKYETLSDMVDIITKKNNAVYSEMVFDSMIRSSLPLPQIEERLDELRTDSPPTLPYRISSYGQKYKPWQIYEKATAGFSGASLKYQENIPLDPCEFGVVGFLSTCETLEMEQKYNLKMAMETRRAMGITSCFTWLAAQAMNQGFNEALDLTYPLTSQTVLSDGQTFSFLKYQLNTMELWKDDKASGPLNLCWASDEEKLYHSVENGQVNDLNEDVIRRLVEMVTAVPKERGYDMKHTLTEKESSYSVPERVIEEVVIEEEKYIL